MWILFRPIFVRASFNFIKLYRMYVSIQLCFQRKLCDVCCRPALRLTKYSKYENVCFCDVQYFVRHNVKTNMWFCFKPFFCKGSNLSNPIFIRFDFEHVLFVRECVFNYIVFPIKFARRALPPRTTSNEILEAWTYTFYLFPLFH